MMKRRGADAQPNTGQRRERASKCLRERCDLAKRPDWSVLHGLYLKPNLSGALQRQRTSSIRCGDAGRPGESTRRLEWKTQ
jgi:hypothetical protein